MEAKKFKVNANGHCKASKEAPDQRTIQLVLAAAKKKPLNGNAIIIARYEWLKRRKLKLPSDMELVNLCLMIKNGMEHRVIYSNV